MTEAYSCDRCQALHEGKPYALLRLHSQEDECNAELCKSCHDTIYSSVNRTE